VSFHSAWISSELPKDAGVTNQPGNLILSFYWKQYIRIRGLFESLLHEPYEFPPLYFPLICPRMLQDTNIDFKFDLKLYHTAKVSALVYNSTFKPLGFAGKV